MGKLVVLKLGAGSFEAGFSVTLQIGDENARPIVEIMGELPPNSEILLCYHQWQSIYLNLKFSGRPIGIPKQSKPNFSIEDCQKAAVNLKVRLNNWLTSESFRPIREKWLEKLLPEDHIRVLLQTNDLRLQKLPWHLWDLLERYPQAEIALSAPIYEQVHRNLVPQSQVKVLAILGNSEGIDIQTDSKLLAELPHANTTFLVEPSSKDLTDQLWEQDWQILFFAGHSATYDSGNEGKIFINHTECLTISQLKYALRKAVERGLHLAIFNSCDGLGLAREFAGLQIPQIIVMREPVPDRVAQEFLKYFLEAFARGESLYIAVREARERLQALETQFPSATWLPVIYQNPAVMPLLWRELHVNQTHQQITFAPQVPTRTGLNLQTALSAVVVASMVTTLLMGVRYFGVLQSWELMAFDHLLRLRPKEKPDSRILVITVTEEDVQAQSPNRRGSLSDETFDQLFAKLEAYQPRVIGLDIYRNYPVQPAYPQLAERMKNSDRFVAVCQVSEPQTGKIGIKPPPEVSPDAVGFSDIVLDADYVVRRHLLALTPPPSSPCTPSYALNVQLTLRYLYAKGIQLQFTPDGAWQLGKLKFKPIEAHTGGYQGVDASGHQILLNYRSFPNNPELIAPRVTLQQVLAGQLQVDAVKDRIVIIGTTAESFRDYSLTPYISPQGRQQEIAGVFLQAHKVSQLLSAVLDGRPLLWTWSVWCEVIWVWSWAVMGSLLAAYLRQPTYLGLTVGAGFLGLYSSCLIILILYSGWIPLVPAAIALGSSVAISVAVKKIRNS